MKYTLIFSIFMTCLITACATMQGSRSVEIDGEPLVYMERGMGSPTIVLEAGLGSGMASWEDIIDPLASISKVFAYSRPGYSSSRETNRPRTPAQIVDDLRRLLAQTGNKPPYVLVGHSLGGLYMLNYVERYPDEVAGVVLVDTRHPLFTQTCQARGLNFCTLPSALRLLTPTHVLSEYDGAQGSRMPSTMGDIPLAVISRGRFGLMESAEWQALWDEMQLGLSELSTRGRHLTAEHAGHFVHKEEPASVLEGVEWVIAQEGG